MPAGWMEKKLGQLLNVQNGFAFDSARFSDTDGMPLIRIRDLRNGIATVIRYVGTFDEQYVVRAGDFLIGMDGEFRCYQWAGEDSLLNQRVCRLVDFKEEIEPEFVRYGINEYLKRIEEATPFVTVRHLSSKAILGIEFSYPDRAEQRRIVTRIKECMEQVDEIENLQEGRALRIGSLMRSVRRELLGLPEVLPAGWKEARLDKLADVIYGISEAISANRDPSIGPPIIRMANMTLDGWLDLSDLRYCAIPNGRKSHFELKKGDLLLNWRSGSASHVGKTAMFNEDGLFTCASFILRIRALAGTNNRYLRHVLNFMRAEAVFSGSSRMQVNHKLNAGEFSAFPIRVPPTIDEQDRIADQLDAAESLVRELKTEADKTTHKTKELRQAILRKAFAGEL